MKTNTVHLQINMQKNLHSRMWYWMPRAVDEDRVIKDYGRDEPEGGRIVDEEAVCIYSSSSRVSINMYDTSEERANVQYMPICRTTHPQFHYGANDEMPTSPSVSTSVNTFPGYLPVGPGRLRRPRHGTRQFPAASCCPECRIRISNTAARRGHTACLAHRTPVRQDWWPRYPMDRQGVKVGGSALLSKNRELSITTRNPITKSGHNQAQLGIAMPRNKVSNDIDHVRKDPQPEKAPKGSPPKPEPLPKYKPMNIKRPFTHGYGSLPRTTPYNDPYAIFSLFFTESTLELLVQYTNKYAFLYPGPKSDNARTWFPTTVNEFRAFLGVSIWMGLHVESGIKDFWNTNPLNGPIHDQVLKHISLKRWEQIDRFFHISKPLKPGQKETTFDKLEPLSAHLREAFKKYWKSGIHLAVDETI